MKEIGRYLDETEANGIAKAHNGNVIKTSMVIGGKIVRGMMTGGHLVTVFVVYVE